MYPTVENTIVFFIINFAILGYSLWLNKKFYKSYCYISLPFVFSLLFFVFYVIVHTYVILAGYTSFYYSDTNDYTYITKTAIFATLVNIFFNIGCTLNIFFKSKKGDYIAKYIKRFDKKSLYKTGLIIFLIGALTKIIYFSVLGGGNIFSYIMTYGRLQLESSSQGVSFDNYLFFLFICLDVGSDILLINYLKNKTHVKSTLFAILITILLSFNKRMALVQILIQYFVIIAIYVKKIRKKIPIYALSVVFPLLLIFVIGLGKFREVTAEHQQKDISAMYFIFGSFHNMKAACDGLEYSNWFGPYYGKNIIMPIILKPVPRRIWKDKPLNGAAIWTDTMRPGALESGFSIAPGILFDSYINFRYVGTLIFFLLLGLIIFRIQYILHKLTMCNPDIIFYPLVIAIVDSHLLMLRGSDIGGIPVYLFYYVPILLITFFRLRIKIY